MPVRSACDEQPVFASELAKRTSLGGAQARPGDFDPMEPGFFERAQMLPRIVDGRVSPGGQRPMLTSHPDGFDEGQVHHRDTVVPRAEVEVERFLNGTYVVVA